MGHSKKVPVNQEIIALRQAMRNVNHSLAA
jgi:hypothetical protein